MPRWRPDAHLTGIDKRLRCRRCGARGQSRLLVTALDRDGWRGRRAAPRLDLAGSSGQQEQT